MFLRFLFNKTLLQVATPTGVVVFCKGSYERLRSRLATGSLPDDYDDTCASLARNGSYVLALAYKDVDPATKMIDVAAWDRDTVECDLKLLGCLTFDNFVKVTRVILWVIIILHMKTLTIF